eukprot:49849-Chlamydomonas_euryale.AAC.2
MRKACDENATERCERRVTGLLTARHARMPACARLQAQCGVLLERLVPHFGSLPLRVLAGVTFAASEIGLAGACPGAAVAAAAAAEARLAAGAAAGVGTGVDAVPSEDERARLRGAAAALRSALSSRADVEEGVDGSVDEGVDALSVFDSVALGTGGEPLPPPAGWFGPELPPWMASPSAPSSVGGAVFHTRGPSSDGVPAAEVAPVSPPPRGTNARIFRSEGVEEQASARSPDEPAQLAFAEAAMQLLSGGSRDAHVGGVDGLADDPVFRRLEDSFAAVLRARPDGSNKVSSGSSTIGGGCDSGGGGSASGGGGDSMGDVRSDNATAVVAPPAPEEPLLLPASFVDLASPGPARRAASGQLPDGSAEEAAGVGVGFGIGHPSARPDGAPSDAAHAAAGCLQRGGDDEALTVSTDGLPETAAAALLVLRRAVADAGRDGDDGADRPGVDAVVAACVLLAVCDGDELERDLQVGAVGAADGAGSGGSACGGLPAEELAALATLLPSLARWLDADDQAIAFASDAAAAAAAVDRPQGGRRQRQRRRAGDVGAGVGRRAPSGELWPCLLYTSPSPRDAHES